MIARYCIVIPCFDNRGTIASVVASCLEHTDFSVLIVDDGSKIPVSSIVSENNRVRIIRFEQNSGKGVALQTAIRDCAERGFTHLISIDADGQHNPAEIKTLVKDSLDHPWDLIIGSRRMREDATPGVSRFGRKFSNFWVWYQTSANIKDSQSGFRIYPVFHVQMLNFFTRRFDFELEVLIRLLWAGVKVRSVPVDVVYFSKELRVSHFDKLWDNVRITLMNIVIIVISLFKLHLNPRKLGLGVFAGLAAGYSFENYLTVFAVLVPVSFFMRLNGFVLLTSSLAAFLSAVYWDPSWWMKGALIAWLPTVAYTISFKSLEALKRRRATWSGKLRGGRFGNWVIRKISYKFGLRATYWCMLFVVPYFVLFAPKARRASLEFSRVVFPEHSMIERLIDVFVHFYRFSTLLLDRLYQSKFEEVQFDCSGSGSAVVRELIGREKGSVLISAHFGALDIGSRTTRNKGVRDKMVRVEFIAESGMTAEIALKRPRFSDHDLASIQQKQQSVLYFRELIEGGKSICLMGDRPMTQQYELVPFFGKLAAFDTTPFKVAAACNTKVTFTFGIKRGLKRYDFLATKPKEINYLPDRDRSLQLWDWANEFAQELESIVRQFPDQWANFYSFWSALPSSPMRELSGKLRVSLYEDLVASPKTRDVARVSTAVREDLPDAPPPLE